MQQAPFPNLLAAARQRDSLNHLQVIIISRSRYPSETILQLDVFAAECHGKFCLLLFI
jgi:hypothetical protein